jgi:hypothetical protein
MCLISENLSNLTLIWVFEFQLLTLIRAAIRKYVAVRLEVIYDSQGKQIGKKGGVVPERHKNAI